MRLAKGKLTLVIALAAAMVTILNVPAPALAQATAMSVTVPFAFHVGEKTLPAGEYIVHRRGEAIEISGKTGNAIFAISTAVPNPASKLDNQLVFNRYGEDCYLSEVRWLGYTTGRGLLKSAKEVELAKAFSGTSVLAAGLSK